MCIIVKEIKVSPLMLIRVKGQIISKANYGILNSSKKQTNKFDFTAMIPEVDLFSFVFWRKLKTPKRYFELTDL